MRIVQEGMQMFPDMKTMMKCYVRRRLNASKRSTIKPVLHAGHPHAEYDNTFQKIEGLEGPPAAHPNPFCRRQRFRQFGSPRFISNAGKRNSPGQRPMHLSFH